MRSDSRDLFAPQPLRAARAAASACLVTLAAVAAGCGSGLHTTTNGGTVGSTGTIAVTLSDAAACELQTGTLLTGVNVTVQKLRFNASSTAQPADSGWAELSTSPPTKTNLLTLINGTTATLGSLTGVTPATYVQMRLLLQATGTGTTVNSVAVGAAELPLDVSGIGSNGLALTTSFPVTAGATTDVVVDVDACRSVFLRADGTFFLDPVARVVPAAGTGSITGSVDTATAALTGTRVTVQKGGAVIGTTVPKADGSWTIGTLPLSASPVDVVVSAPARATTVLTGVALSATAAVSAGTIAPAVVTGSFPVRTLLGTVTPVDRKARLRVVQQVGTSVVEVASGTVVYNAGDWRLTVPSASAQIATWASGGGWTYRAFDDSRGQYTVEAAAPDDAGKPLSQTAVLDVRSTDLRLDLQLQ